VLDLDQCEACDGIEVLDLDDVLDATGLMPCLAGEQQLTAVRLGRRAAPLDRGSGRYRNRDSWWFHEVIGMVPVSCRGIPVPSPAAREGP
jgi:hypothetical protein